MHIHHFILDSRIGGPHIYVQTLIKELSDIKQDITTSGRCNISIRYLINLRRFWSPLYFFEVIFNSIILVFVSFFHKSDKGVVIFDVHGVMNIAPLIAARILGIPVVWHFHETHLGYSFFFKVGKVFLKKNKYKIIVVANKVGEVYKLKSFDLIYSPIDTTYWDVSKKNKIKRNSDTPLKILCVGNLNPLKGQDLLLSALSDFSEPYELNIVGAKLSSQKAYFTQLKEMTAKLIGINNNAEIYFLGWKSHNEIRSLMSSCDVFVLPSRSEACPIALLEAMAMKCICIGTNVGGVSEIIRNKDIGFLIEPNKYSIFLALSHIHNVSLKERMIMGNQARNEVVERFSKENISKQHRDVYNELLNRMV